MAPSMVRIHPGPEDTSVSSSGGGETGDLRADALALHRALSELIRVYQFRDRDRICCHDISVTQCHALDLLVLTGPLTLNEVAAGLYLDKSTASRVVNALQRKGYLERQPHPEDRRALRLSATPAGRKLQRTIQEEILRQEELLLASFSPEVREAIPDVLHALARAASERVDTSGGSCCSLDSSP